MISFSYTLKSLVCASAGLFLSVATQAMVVAELDDPLNGSARKPAENIRLAFATPITAEESQTLVLELDAIDITPMATITPEGIEYRPVQPLFYGQHELRLVSYGADGSIDEVGYWQIEVRQSAGFQQASLTTQTDITLTQLVDEKNLDSDDEFTGQGVFVAQSAMLNENYRVDAYMDMFALDDRNKSPTNKAVDLNNYYISAQGGGYQFGMGSQAYANTNLLQDGLQKRGLNVAKEFATLNTRASVFSYSSQNIIGFNDFSGIQESDSRVTGTTFSAAPYQSEDTEIITSASYYYGRDEAASYNYLLAGQAQVNEGDGSNLVIDSTFFKRQLRVRLEGAQTRYDFDGREFGFDAERDNAYSALVLYTPTPASDSLSPFVWSVGGEVVSVGGFFRSVANPGLPGDRYMQRVFGQMSKSQFTLDASFAQEENNLDGDSNLPTTESSEWFVASYYTFPAPTEDKIWRRWLGTPTLSLTFNGADSQDQLALASFVNNDWDVQGINARADFRYNQWSWALTHGVNQFEDFTDTQVDSKTQNTQVDAQLNLSQRWNLTSGWQWQQTLNKDYGTVTDVTVYSLGAGAILIPDKLTATLSFNRSDNDASDDALYAQDVNLDYWAGSINWTVLPVRNNSVGVELALTVNTQDYTDKIFNANSRDTMQAFFSIRTIIPTVYPGGNR